MAFTSSNTSRGKLIDSAALIAGLKSRKIGGAGLDVYEEESDYFFEDRSGYAIDDDILARLMTFPNVLITSHQAFFTREAMTNISNVTLKNIEDFVKGRELVNCICYQCDGNRQCPGKGDMPPPAKVSRNLKRKSPAAIRFRHTSGGFTCRRFFCFFFITDS